jgi:hypothetical protein
MIPPPWFLLDDPSSSRIKLNQSQTSQIKSTNINSNQHICNDMKPHEKQFSTPQLKCNQNNSNQIKTNPIDTDQVRLNQIKSNQILSPLSPLLSPLYCLLSAVPTSDVTVIKGRKTLFGVSYWCHIYIYIYIYIYPWLLVLSTRAPTLPHGRVPFQMG